MKQYAVLAALMMAAVWALAANPVEHGILIREAQVYLQPDAASAKLARMERGREVHILEKSGDWIHAVCTLDVNRETGESKDITGWLLDKGVIRNTTPNGDKILFGEAAASEAEASRRGGRRGADRDALRLYYRVFDYFPQSPLAGEALYRAADIRWQLDRADVMTRASARTANPRDRFGMDEDAMKQVQKKFPGSRWADLAAFHLIDNKLCGDWEGLPKCPEREAELYEKYAQEHPQSPAAAEALYNAAWRQAALMVLYPADGKAGKVPEAKAKATALAQRVVSAYPQSDWAARAQTLLYDIEQGIPVYGNALQ
jgi:hypothetical protein